MQPPVLVFRQALHILHYFQLGECLRVRSVLITCISFVELNACIDDDAIAPFLALFQSEYPKSTVLEWVFDACDGIFVVEITQCMKWCEGSSLNAPACSSLLVQLPLFICSSVSLFGKMQSHKQSYECKPAKP